VWNVVALEEIGKRAREVLLSQPCPLEASFPVSL